MAAFGASHEGQTVTAKPVGVGNSGTVAPEISGVAPRAASSPWLKSAGCVEIPGLQNRIALRCFYGDGHSQRSAAAGGSLDHACRIGHGTGASVLPTSERTAGPGEVRRVCRKRVRPILCRPQRPSVADARNVFSVAADRLF